MGRFAFAAGWTVLGILIGAVGGWELRDRVPRPWRAPTVGTVMARRAAVAHATYSPEVRHPVEVGADQEAHLVAWLSKRLGSPVRAPKLEDVGYSLVGGGCFPEITARWRISCTSAPAERASRCMYAPRQRATARPRSATRGRQGARVLLGGPQVRLRALLRRYQQGRSLQGRQRGLPAAQSLAPSRCARAGSRRTGLVSSIPASRRKTTAYPGTVGAIPALIRITGGYVMSLFRSCTCGRHSSHAEHELALAEERVAEEAVLRAAFQEPDCAGGFAAVGTGTALAALSQRSHSAQRRRPLRKAAKLEKKKLKVGFIPITCATPIIMAHPMGFTPSTASTSRWSRPPAGR